MSEGPAQPHSSTAPLDGAMMTGSDAGEPGERLSPPPLTDTDRVLLQELATRSEPVVQPVEEQAATVGAAEDDAPLPLETAPGQPDELNPEFRGPNS